MSHEPYAELASGYALTALADDDRARFEGHLQAGCAECEALLADYTETVASLARELPPTPPPPAVRARLLQRVAADAARREPRPVPRETRPARRRLFWPILATASLAAAAALLVYLGVTIGELRQEARARAEELATLRGEVARQRELVALLGAPETRTVTLEGLPPSPGASARMWWNDSRRAGYFVASGLPAVPAGKTYQLWVIAAGKPVSAGIFPVDPRGEATLRVDPVPTAGAAEVFAVTLEPAGGLPAPSGQMYLAGKST
jgi:anti-sigma-K factor RskA